jgi:hypothetical protein
MFTNEADLAASAAAGSLVSGAVLPRSRTIVWWWGDAPFLRKLSLTTDQSGGIDEVFLT